MPARRVADVPAIRFLNVPRTRWGVDCLSLRELRRRAPETLHAPQRLAFNLLLLVQSGESEHVVDFEPVRLRAGSVLWVRAGQVQQWRLDPRLQGQLVLLTPDALELVLDSAGRDRAWAAVDEWPGRMSIPAPGMAALARLAGVLGDALVGAEAGPQGSVALHHLVLALLLRVAQHGAPQPPRGMRRELQLVQRVFRAIEAAGGRRVRVAELCRRLSVSQSTLARACRATQGASVKAVVDRRTALEAKRLLVETDEPVARLAERLGFDEPTNFTKFFRRLEGTTPAAYRARYR